MWFSDLPQPGGTTISMNPESVCAESFPLPREPGSVCSVCARQPVSGPMRQPFGRCSPELSPGVELWRRVERSNARVEEPGIMSGARRGATREPLTAENSGHQG